SPSLVYGQGGQPAVAHGYLRFPVARQKQPETGYPMDAGEKCALADRRSAASWSLHLALAQAPPYLSGSLVGAYHEYAKAPVYLARLHQPRLSRDAATVRFLGQYHPCPLDLRY